MRKKNNTMMTVEEVAKIMGTLPQTIRIGLQRKTFPFGWCIKQNDRYSYYIPRKLFEDYFGRSF